MSQVQGRCFIWNTMCLQEKDGDGFKVDSPRAGGIYFITGTAVSVLGGLQLSTRLLVALTEFLRSERNAGKLPIITSDTLKDLSPTELSISVRRDRLLIWFSKKLPLIGQAIKIPGIASEKIVRNNMDDSSWSSSSELHELYQLSAEVGVVSIDETQVLLRYCIEQGYMQIAPSGFSLTFAGIDYVEKLNSAGTSHKAFVAMWFAEEMEEIYEQGIKQGVLDSGYEPIRIDRVEHNNKIDDEIIAEIRRSKFVVADFTSQMLLKSKHPGLITDTLIVRGGVYFEAGFAKGLNKEVIWTVRKDLIDFVHFDTRQFAHITWSSADDLRKSLGARISATLGDGPLKRLG